MERNVTALLIIVGYQACGVCMDSDKLSSHKSGFDRYSFEDSFEDPFGDSLEDSFEFRTFVVKEVLSPYSLANRYHRTLTHRRISRPRFEIAAANNITNLTYKLAPRDLVK